MVDSDETQRAWAEWLAERPPAVRAFAERYPFGCYRDRSRGHYQIISYEEHTDGSVTMKILHGRDSTLPGTAVFGVTGADLVPCGCGQWEERTEDQAQFVDSAIDSLIGTPEERQLMLALLMLNCPR
jgi:hypothetical protein